MKIKQESNGFQCNQTFLIRNFLKINITSIKTKGKQTEVLIRRDEQGAVSVGVKGYEAIEKS